MNNTLIPFEVDTGVAVSIMSHNSYKQYLPHVKLNSTEIGLQTYIAEPVKVLGEAQVHVIYIRRVQGYTEVVCCRGGQVQT